MKPDISQEEENEGEDDEAPMESAERKEHASDGQTGEENVQSDTAVELAGAASERDQAKEVRKCQPYKIICFIS